MQTYEQLDSWREDALSDLRDHRVIDPVWMDVHVWFFLHLYAEFVNVEWVLRGFSFRERDGVWLLVLKVSFDDIPQVVFVSSDTPTHCMSKLRKLLREDQAQFYPDKYA